MSDWGGAGRLRRRDFESLLEVKLLRGFWLLKRESMARSFCRFFSAGRKQKQEVRDIPRFMTAETMEQAGTMN